MSDSPPNPGSPEAVALGCRCPVMDNARGRGAPGWKDEQGTPLFWYSDDCKLHAPELTGPKPVNGEDFDD